MRLRPAPGAHVRWPGRRPVTALAAMALLLGAATIAPGGAAPAVVASDVSERAEQADAPAVFVPDHLGMVRQGGDLHASDAPAAVRSGAAPTGAAVGDAPVRPTLWFRAAAEEYGVSAQLLEALHQVESNAAPDSCIANLEGSGAIGPFQFKPATFAQVGIDANRDGIRDICGFADALFSAARYLKMHGADADPTSDASRRALVRYGTDAAAVQSLARAYQERDGLATPAAAR